MARLYGDVFEEDHDRAWRQRCEKYYRGWISAETWEEMKERGEADCCMYDFQLQEVGD